MTATHSRHLIGRAATLALTGSDENGEPVDPGTVTVAVTNSQGTAVTVGAVTGTGTTRNAVVAAANNLTLDTLTAVWTVSGATYATTYHDIVGGYFATVTEIRAGTALMDAVEHSDAALIADRWEVETKVTDACGRAFVPTYAKIDTRGYGTSKLVLPYPDLTRVRWATYFDGTAWTAITPTVSYIPANDAGVAELQDGVWPNAPIRVGIEHGMPTVPADLKEATIKAIGGHRHSEKSALPSGALVFTDSGMTVRMGVEGDRGWVFKDPHINEVIGRYRHAPPRVA